MNNVSISYRDGDRYDCTWKDGDGPQITTELRKIFEFKVYWHAWECDSEGYVMEDVTGKRHLILTNHGSMYIAEEQQALAKIEEYQEAIRETQKALYLLHPPR